MKYSVYFYTRIFIFHLSKQQSKLVAVPWDSVKDNRKSWVVRKGHEQVRFCRSEIDNNSFTMQKDKERVLTLQSFQARDTYRHLIENGYKLGR